MREVPMVLSFFLLIKGPRGVQCSAVLALNAKPWLSHTHYHQWLKVLIFYLCLVLCRMWEPTSKSMPVLFEVRFYAVCCENNCWCKEKCNNDWEVCVATVFSKKKKHNDFQIWTTWVPRYCLEELEQVLAEMKIWQWFALNGSIEYLWSKK